MEEKEEEEDNKRHLEGLRRAAASRTVRWSIGRSTAYYDAIYSATANNKRRKKEWKVAAPLLVFFVFFFFFFC